MSRFDLQVAVNQVMTAEKKKDLFIDNTTWTTFLAEAENHENKEYTIIYREPSGELREAWHWLSQENFEYIHTKYLTEKKEIVRFVEKVLPFGEYLKSIHGGSDDVRN